MFWIDLQIISLTLLRVCASVCARCLVPASDLAAATCSSIKLHLGMSLGIESTYEEILELVEVVDQISQRMSHIAFLEKFLCW